MRQQWEQRRGEPRQPFFQIPQSTHYPACILKDCLLSQNVKCQNVKRCGVGGFLPISALKHAYQLRGMGITLCMHTSISPQQWQSWTAVLPLWGLISMAHLSGL